MTKINPVSYAESNLGVHAVYNEANRLRDDHARTTGVLISCSSDIRSVKAQIEDIELGVIADERAKEHGLSKTAFGEHLKEVLRAHPDLRALRQLLDGYEAEKAGHELDLKHTALRIQIAVARMQELDGLLTFYAACKLEASQHVQQQTGD